MKHGPGSKSLEVEAVISELLRWGVRASLFLLAGGTLLCFFRGQDYGRAGGSVEDLHRLITQTEGFPRSLSWLFTGLARLDGQAVLVVGMLLLISTPILRVLVSIVAFALEKDRAYVVITTVVFLLLLVSFLLGKVG